MSRDLPRQRERQRKWKQQQRLKDPAKSREADRARYKRDKERILERQKSYRDADPSKNQERAAAWYAEHKHEPQVKARRAAYNERWKSENRERHLAARKRRRKQRMADPVLAEKERMYRSAAQRKRTAGFKAIALEAKASGCQECGEMEPVCLDFHHRDPSTKLYSIGKNISRFSNADVLVAEIVKCDVVCGNCHQKYYPQVRNVRDPSAKKYLNGVGDRARREEKWGHVIARAKRGGCTLCPEDVDRVLQFHHVDPATKKFGVGNYQQLPMKTDIWPEIQRCMILCVNCHRRVHAGIAMLPQVALEDYWRERLAA